MNKKLLKLHGIFSAGQNRPTEKGYENFLLSIWKYILKFKFDWFFKINFLSILDNFKVIKVVLNH